jgi:hypothetical protein
MADPSDFTEQFNTKLSPEDEAKFQTWAKSLGSQGNTYDYDLRGAFKSGAGQAANGHFPDTFKKPNHPTFSDQSQYSTPDTPGGHWEQQPDKTWSFTTSPYQLQHHSAEDLQNYFKKVEPSNKLIVQPPTMLDAVSKALQDFGTGELGPK